MANRGNTTNINEVRNSEARIRSLEPGVIEEQLDGLQDGLGELPDLVAEVVEDRLSAFGDEILADLDLALERAFAEEDEHYSPNDLIDGLNDHRERGYQFFCVHAEPYRDDPDVVAAEQSLLTLANSPIRAGAVKRNRRELDGWMAITNGTFEDSAFNQDGSLRKDIVLAMARLVVLCGDGEAPTKPVERLWPALDADDNLRESLRAMYSIGPPRRAKASIFRRNPQPRGKKATRTPTRRPGAPQSMPSPKNQLVTVPGRSRTSSEGRDRATSANASRKS